MTTFEDGPAKGQNLMLKRAQRFLRVVEADGKWDALDQPNDQPEPGEKIYAYELSGKPGMVHLNFGRRGGGFYQIATYRILNQQPTDSEMRDNECWQRYIAARSSWPR